MKGRDLIGFKEWLHDEIQQAKPYYKRIKRLTMYENNKPIKLTKKYSNKLK